MSLMQRIGLVVQALLLPSAQVGGETNHRCTHIFSDVPREEGKPCRRRNVFLGTTTESQPAPDHCGGGAGADTVDYLTYMEQWVKQGRALARQITLPPSISFDGSHF